MTESNHTSEPLDYDQTGVPMRLFWCIIGLHLLTVLLNVVPLFFYFQRSWELEHYQFFPIALAVFGWLVWQRIDAGKLRETRWLPFTSGLMLLGAAVCFLVSFSQYNHYLPSVGVIFVIGSLLNCLKEKESNRSLFPLWLLLVPLIRIPLNFDITLISQLQFVSAWFASNVLDFLGISNFTPGTVIQIAREGVEQGVKRFDVERACSGVQSLYALLFCTLTVAVVSKRTLVTGFFLVLSGVFWSIVMNGVRIVIVVASFSWFDWDLYSKVPHEILGYAILLAAVGMIASTDAILGFATGPVGGATGPNNLFAKIWNRYVSGVEAESARQSQQEAGPVGATQRRRILLIGSLGIANVFGFLVLVQSLSGENFGGRKKIGEIDFGKNEFSEQIVDDSDSKRIWVNKPLEFRRTTRNKNSTYGPYSSSWTFSDTNTGQPVVVSLDYIFLGWHELSVCYRASGWKIERIVVPDPEWNSVELFMKNDHGNYGFCVFSLFDFKGEPVEPFSDNLGFFMLRLRNRIARELTSKTTFQIQCFSQSFQEFSKDQLDAIRRFHQKTRELARDRVLEKIETE